MFGEQLCNLTEILQARVINGGARVEEGVTNQTQQPDVHRPIKSGKFLKGFAGAENLEKNDFVGKKSEENDPFSLWETSFFLYKPRLIWARLTESRYANGNPLSLTYP